MYRRCWISGDKLVRNCWARELGQEAMAAAEEESRVGTRDRKDWSISVGE